MRVCTVVVAVAMAMAGSFLLQVALLLLVGGWSLLAVDASSIASAFSRFLASPRSSPYLPTSSAPPFRPSIPTIIH